MCGLFKYTKIIKINKVKNNLSEQVNSKEQKITFIIYNK